jgi:uncharacterized protein
MVHQYKLNGYNIVLDVDSGSIHLVDDLVYEIVSLYEKSDRDGIVHALSDRFNHDDIRSALDDVQELVDQQKLFSHGDYPARLFDGSHSGASVESQSKEQYSLIEYPSCPDGDVATSYRKDNDIIKALCLNVAHTCNLDCSYCFAGQGKYKGEQALMSLETGKKAIDFLMERSGSRRNLEVDFFGGEPLLNWQMVKDVVAYARSIEKKAGKHFRFTLTTNGILINDNVIEFTNKEMHNVVLSLDGRPHVHDRFRVDIGGEGSYARIVPKFLELVRRRNRGTYYVRGTYTHLNTDFLNDILHMLDLGFREISMEPVVCRPEEPYALTDEDLPIIFEQYEKLAEEMLRREREGDPFEFYHFMIDLEHGPCIYKRITGCGAGTEYLAVTPSGDLYPCHQLVDDPSFKIGTLDDGVTELDLQNEFRKCNVFARDACRDCWAKLYCAGGCAANAFHMSGSLLGTDKFGCELFKKRIECAIMIKVAKAVASTT